MNRRDVLHTCLCRTIMRRTQYVSTENKANFGECRDVLHTSQIRTDEWRRTQYVSTICSSGFFLWESERI